MQTADDEHVERAALTKAFRRGRREVVAVAEQGRVEDARGLGLEARIDLLLQARPPVVEPCKWRKYTRIAESCDPSGTFD